MYFITASIRVSITGADITAIITLPAISILSAAAFSPASAHTSPAKRHMYATAAIFSALPS